MAGATNRSFKAAGIPRKAAAEIRLKAGGRLTLKSALDVAAKHGIDVPPKAHDFAAQRDRKVALKTAKARRAERLTKSIGDASRISRDMRRKAAADAQKVSAGLDSVAKRSKAGAMGAKLRKSATGKRGARLTTTDTQGVYTWKNEKTGETFKISRGRSGNRGMSWTAVGSKGTFIDHPLLPLVRSRLAVLAE